MSSQSDRVDTILRQLHEAERDRRLVARGGPNHNFAQHNVLANQIRDQIGQLSTPDLRSVLIRMVVTSLNGNMWARCESCGRPDYLGEAIQSSPASAHYGLAEAVRLLEYALHLRQHGERAPGGNETWAQFDRECEALLRGEPTAGTLGFPRESECDCGHDGLDPMFHLRPCPVAELRASVRKLGYRLELLGEETS